MILSACGKDSGLILFVMTVCVCVCVKERERVCVCVFVCNLTYKLNLKILTQGVILYTQP